VARRCDSVMIEVGTENRLRQRLWGAVVLIAIAVIVLPLLLDGAGSESQFRRVEQLREAPQVPEQRSPDRALAPQLAPANPAQVRAPESQAEPEAQSLPAEVALPAPALTAWVVQAAAFTQENDARALRDQLRSAGYASFVGDRDAESDSFRVLVGPMIRKQTAEKARKSVAALLNNDPIIMSYP